MLPQIWLPSSLLSWLGNLLIQLLYVHKLQLAAPGYLYKAESPRHIDPHFGSSWMIPSWDTYISLFIRTLIQSAQHGCRQHQLKPSLDLFGQTNSFENRRNCITCQWMVIL